MSAKWFDTLLCHALENVCATNSIEKVQIIVNNDMPEDYVLQENGFVIDTHVPAEYTYLIRSRRVTEVDISKEIFEKLPSLKYDANLSTKELIDLNGLKKIWDSGRTIWTKSLQPGKILSDTVPSSAPTESSDGTVSCALIPLRDHVNIQLTL